MRIYQLVEAESLWALSGRGSVNLPQVKELQDRLRAAGFNPGPSDGWYGQRTANAVRAYQEANSLTVDGDAGPQTLASLGIGGAERTPPRPTPPEETPPAPAPRNPASEPPDEPAPRPEPEPDPEPETTPTRPAPEPEPETTPARPAPEPAPEPTTSEPEPAVEIPFSNIQQQGGKIRIPSEPSARDMRNAIGQITEIEGIRLLDFTPGYDNPPIVTVGVEMPEGLTPGQERQAARNILDFLQEKIVSNTEIELNVAVEDTNSNLLIYSTIFLDADTNTGLPTMPTGDSTTGTPEPEPETDGQDSIPDISVIRDTFEENGFDTGRNSEVQTDNSGNTVIMLYLNPNEEIQRSWLSDDWITYFDLAGRDPAGAAEFWERNLKTSDRMRISMFDHADTQMLVVMVNELPDILDELNIPAGTRLLLYPTRDEWTSLNLEWDGNNLNTVRRNNESIDRLSTLAGIK